MKNIERIKNKILNISLIFNKHESLRKTLVFFALISSIFVLVIFSKDVKTSGFTKEQLKIEKQFPNGTGSIKINSKIYSSENKMLVLNLETKDLTSSNVDIGIDIDKLDWVIGSKAKIPNLEMDVLPITDNKITLVIKNVPENHSPIGVVISSSQKKISTTIYSNDSKYSSQSQSSSDQAEQNQSDDNDIIFYLIDDDSTIIKNNIKDYSQTTFLLSSLQEEKQKQDNYIKQLQQQKSDIKDSITDDNKKIETLNKKSIYLTGNDKTNNDNDITSLKNNILNKNNSITQIDNNISISENRIDGINKNIDDIKNKKYNFDKGIKKIIPDTENN